MGSQEEKSSDWSHDVQLTRYNVWTNYGLTALAGALNGSYLAPQYLEIENNGTGITNASGITAGATSCTATTNVLEAGDTQIILGIGTATRRQ